MSYPMLNRRARGILALRADNTGIQALIGDLQRTFEAFKAERDKELADIKKKMGDVVQSEKVDRINAEIETLQAQIDETNRLLAAARIGSGENETNPDVQAHSDAFNRFFRRGVENNLGELAVKAALQTDSQTDGGYVVPEEMSNTIDRVLGVVSAMRSISSVITISTGTYKKIVNQGGAEAGWVAERASRPETATPTLTELAFEAMELYANPATTQTLLDDARVNIAEWLANEVSITFAEQEASAFISGTGVGQPRGLLSYDTVADANYQWGKIGFVVTGVAADVSDASNNGVDSLIDLVYAIKQGYRSNSRFLMNRTLQSKYRKVKDENGQYLWQPPVQAGQPASMLGYSIVDDDNMSDVGANAFPVAFGDFRRAYLIVDRFGVRVLRDPYTNKPYVMFYTTKRVGGGVQNFEAVKLLKCSG